MVQKNQPSYDIAGHETLAETPELRMVVLTLAVGQEVPWHWHSNVADRFFCMEGPMVVETRAPREIFELHPGGTCVVPAKRAHRVTGKNGGPFKFERAAGRGRPMISIRSAVKGGRSITSGARPGPTFHRGARFIARTSIERS